MQSGERALGESRNEVQIEAPADTPRAYVAPQLISLGSLQDLTRGGDASAEDDGVGFAGASGSF